MNLVNVSTGDVAAALSPDCPFAVEIELRNTPIARHKVKI